MLQSLWFGLWGLLWAVYFMLDGFDFGAGMLHPFIGRTDMERRQIINSLGPVWDGNEVWLVTAGGATFAAFPATYAYMFSWFYTPLLIILFGLIIRGVSFEFRGKADSEKWKKTWDFLISVSSFVPPLLFGVAFGNIFQGLLIDGYGYFGTTLSLLNPYGLLTGAVFVIFFLAHGALWIGLKTEGGSAERAKALLPYLLPLLAFAVVMFLIATYFSTPLFNNFFKMPALFILPIICAAGIVYIYVIYKKSMFQAFLASCVSVFTFVFTGIAGLYPNLLPSKVNDAYNITAFNSSSSDYTLKIMTVVVLIFVPIVIAYQIWTYYIFRHPVKPEDVTDPDVETY